MDANKIKEFSELYIKQKTFEGYQKLYMLLFEDANRQVVEADNTLFVLQSVSRIWKMEVDLSVSTVFDGTEELGDVVKKYQRLKFLARRLEQGMGAEQIEPLMQMLLNQGLSPYALFYVIKKEVRKSMQTMLLAAGYLKKLGQDEKSECLIQLVAQTAFEAYEREPIVCEQNSINRYQEKYYEPCKVTFVVCTNDLQYMRECELYIGRLYVPSWCEIELLSIAEAPSMCEGYNAGQAASKDAIHVYLHQDVFITNRYFLYDIFELFDSDDAIGMIGMVGSKELPADATMWHGKRVGVIYSASDVDTSHVENRLEPVPTTRVYEEVEVLDGMLLVSNRNIPFREELFDGWDFYDLSACMEHRKMGYKIVVPSQDKPWCIHDCGSANLSRYETYRQLFLQEYGEMMLSHPI